MSSKASHNEVAKAGLSSLRETINTTSSSMDFVHAFGVHDCYKNKDASNSNDL